MTDLVKHPANPPNTLMIDVVIHRLLCFPNTLMTKLVMHTPDRAMIDLVIKSAAVPTHPNICSDPVNANPSSVSQQHVRVKGV